ncbi:MAG: hypothetical protein KGY45_05020, partial [Hadesarchaea archaeon]|nr:hypothetical protein [Hadesarchaea archaeon]
MGINSCDKGFIFSFDATFAVFVSLIILAGVASSYNPTLNYEQHGRLRLERYASDAMEVMVLTETLEGIVASIKNGEIENAREVARREFKKTLPQNCQFKLVIGNPNNPRIDPVYPNDNNISEWQSEFENAEDIATSVRLSTFPPRENIRVLTYVDDDLDDNFLALLEASTNLVIDNTSDNDEFWSLLSSSTDYDVVFLPDAEEEFNPNYLNNFVNFCKDGGRIVAGGKTLWYNYDDGADEDLWEILGVQNNRNRPPENSGQPLDNMHIINGENFVTRPYEVCENVEYNENYSMYTYTPLDDDYVVSQWEETPTGTEIPGIIVRPENYTSSDGNTYPEPSVL